MFIPSRPPRLTHVLTRPSPPSPQQGAAICRVLTCFLLNSVAWGFSFPILSQEPSCPPALFFARAAHAATPCPRRPPGMNDAALLCPGDQAFIPPGQRQDCGAARLGRKPHPRWPVPPKGQACPYPTGAFWGTASSRDRAREQQLASPDGDGPEAGSSRGKASGCLPGPLGGWRPRSGPWSRTGSSATLLPVIPSRASGAPVRPRVATDGGAASGPGPAQGGGGGRREVPGAGLGLGPSGPGPVCLQNLSLGRGRTASAITEHGPGLRGHRPAGAVWSAGQTVHGVRRHREGSCGGFLAEGGG